MLASIRDRADRVRLIGGKAALVAMAALTALAVVYVWPKSTFGVATVALQWENTFALDGRPLDETEIAVVKLWAAHTMRRAYSGFAVEVSEGHGTNVIHIRDACAQPECDADSAGDTWLFSKSSNVYYNVLARRALSHGKQQNGDRMQVLRGLGQGIGATAAHELGHEWPIRMPSVDQRHDKNGYDYYSFDRPEHFYGQLHWTEDSLKLLRKSLRY